VESLQALGILQLVRLGLKGGAIVVSSKKALHKKGDLLKQLELAQAQVRADGYEMSIGELISIYEKGEIEISPSYQRLFRWSLEQKSSFIESILIGIPIPPLFVFQNADGRWELVDGLQRLSTLLEFRGVLRKGDAKSKKMPASRLLGTSLLPELENISWSKSADAKELPDALKLRVQRARIRVEILQTGSSPRSRFELFQRLNTGGSLLTRQEIRTCSVIMANPKFQAWLESLAKFKPFVESTKLTAIAKERQRATELVVKYLVLNHVSYKSGWDLHDYLDHGIVQLALATAKEFDKAKEEERFKEVFSLIHQQLSARAFRRESKGKLVGSFSDAAFEALSVGVRENYSKLHANPTSLQTKVLAMWGKEEFKKNTGAGVRGTTRIVKIVPFAKTFFS